LTLLKSYVQQLLEDSDLPESSWITLSSSPFAGRLDLDQGISCTIREPLGGPSDSFCIEGDVAPYASIHQKDRKRRSEILLYIMRGNLFGKGTGQGILFLKNVPKDAPKDVSKDGATAEEDETREEVICLKKEICHCVDFSVFKEQVTLLANLIELWRERLTCVQ